MISLLLAGLALVQVGPLRTYMMKPEPRSEFKSVEPYEGCQTLELVSQSWRGLDWKHRIVVVSPAKPVKEANDLAFLHITGGDPNPRDLAAMRQLSDLSGLPVAILFDIPNQPLFGDLNEDALIAYTFLQYVDGGDDEWPLLLPMVKSVIKAMDAVEKTTTSKRFIVNGASKRGWTTWLAAATGDKRIVGIAPMVYDNLNIPAQMRRQGETFAGGHSDQISDYARAGLLEKMATPRGQALLGVIDPYFYRQAIEVPKLLINGSNDPYWPVDALGLYWDALAGRKAARVVPNAGHDLGDPALWMPTLAAFGSALATDGGFPIVRWTWADRQLTMDGVRQHVESAKLWVAESDSLDFRQSKWLPARAEKGMRRTVFTLPVGRKNQAAYGELTFKVNGIEFSLTTAPKVFFATK